MSIASYGWQGERDSIQHNGINVNKCNSQDDRTEQVTFILQFLCFELAFLTTVFRQIN